MVQQIVVGGKAFAMTVVFRTRHVAEGYVERNFAAVLTADPPCWAFSDKDSLTAEEMARIAAAVAGGREGEVSDFAWEPLNSGANGVTT
jgi:hypothetical protein